MEFTNLHVKAIVLGVLLTFLVGLSYAAPFAYIPNFSDSTVSVIDTATLLVTDTVTVATQPSNVEVSPNGKIVYIAHSTTSTVSAIDAISNEVEAEIDVGLGPGEIIAHPRESILYVAVASDDEVAVIDASSYSVVESIPVGVLPIGMAVQPDGSVLYVVNAVSNDISVIDTATNTVVDTFGYFPAANKGMVVHPDGSIIYVLDGDEIAVISTATHSVNERIPLHVWAIELGIHPDGHTLYATAHTDDLVLVIDTASNSLDEIIPVGGEPLGINVHPDRSSVYVVCQDEGEVYVLDSITYTLIDKIPVGSAPVAFGRFIGPLPEQVGGTVTGVSVEKIVCRNRTTRQRVVIDVEEEDTDTWNCEAAGLDVQPGDIVIQTVSGVAQ